MKLEQLKKHWEVFSEMPNVDEGIKRVYISPILAMIIIEINDWIDNATYELLREKGVECGFKDIQISTASKHACIVISNYELMDDFPGVIYERLEDPLEGAGVTIPNEPCFEGYNPKKLENKTEELIYWIFEEGYSQHDDGFFRKPGSGETFEAKDIINCFNSKN